MKKKTRNVGKKFLSGAAALCLASTIAVSGISSFRAYATSDANGKWYPDYATIEESHKYADEINVQIMEEGVVLMKNNENALPLKVGSGITMLGACTYNVVAGGTGAGSGAGISVTLQKALRTSGFKVNSMAEDFYSKLTSTASISSGMYGGSGTAQTVQENPSLLRPIEDSMHNFKTVVWSISRVGGEGSDLSRGGLPNNEDKSKHYLEFNDNELAMIDYFSQLKEEGKIEKVVMLINSPNVIEMGPAQNNDAIDAILWIGQPGPNGLTGVANVLAGDVSPSGRTVDLWNADHKKDPTWANFGDNSQNTWNEAEQAFDQNSVYNTNNGYVDEETSHNSHVVEYEEGIYFGYKYYETADAEAKAGNYTGFVYDEQVVYPFGYGLSYTSFSQEIVTPATEIEKAINLASGLDAKVEVSVKVQNIGSVAGKEVVQLYSHAPYTKNGIEKPEIALVAFGKTKTLLPGESETVKLEVRLGDIASFDYNDANANKYKGWEIEAGDYQLRLQKNSHEVIDTVDLKLTAKTTELDSDDNASNNTPLSNGDDFDTLLNLKEEDSESTMKVMSRADFVGTFPTAASKAERVYGERLLALMSNTRTGSAGNNTNESRYLGNTNSSDDKETDPWYKTNADIPSIWTQAASVEGRTNGKTAVQMSQMAGYDYWDDKTILPEGHPYAGRTAKEAWNLFMNQLTYQELTSLLNNGSYRTPGLDSVGKDVGSDQDGPTRLTRNGYTFATAIVLASTWNVDLAYEHGRIIGNDSLFTDTPGWYAPSMNTHRNPFCGRNFEYYSQDSLLAGKMAAGDVLGYQSKGGYVYIKHFALNEAETDRNGLTTFVSEQAARENYLKSFEYAVKEGGAMAVMTSFNRIGAIHGSGNYATTQAILRDEWGFHGQIVTDFYMGTMVRGNMGVRAGTELPLGRNWGDITGTWDATLRDGKGGVRDGNADAEGVIPESATQYYVVRNGAMHILWVGANSNVNENSLDKTAIADMTVDAVAGIAINKAIEIDTEKLGTSNITYSITRGTLPDGISFNETTGTFTGTTLAVGSSTITVTVKADYWISIPFTVTFNVLPLVEATVGEAGTTLAINSNVVIGEAPTTADPIGTSAVTAKSIQSVTGLPEGLSYDAETGMIVGTTSETDYKYTVNVRLTTVTITSGWRGATVTTRNNDIAFVITVGNPAPEPVESKSLAGAAINEQGHLILTYTDGTTEDLGLVVGAEGEAGNRGQTGAIGATGEKGVGIKSIEKTSSEGLVDTYTITFTDDSTTTFTITNGANGQNGVNGQDGKDGKDGQNGKDAENKGGCKGSIDEIGLLGGVLALGAVIVLLRKKVGKEEA